MKNILPAWNVAVWSYGHLRSSKDFNTENAALKFARAGKDDLRVVSASAKAEGLTGQSAGHRYFGNKEHGFGGKLARKE